MIKQCIFHPYSITLYKYICKYYPVFLKLTLCKTCIQKQTDKIVHNPAFQHYIIKIYLQIQASISKIDIIYNQKYTDKIVHTPAFQQYIIKIYLLQYKTISPTLKIYLQMCKTRPKYKDRKDLIAGRVCVTGHFPLKAMKTIFILLLDLDSYEAIYIYIYLQFKEVCSVRYSRVLPI